MRLAGKLGGRGGSTDTGPGSGPDCCHVAAADSSTATSNHRLFFLQDGETGRRFLIDIGSSFSILLSAAESQYSAFDRELLAVYAALLHFLYLLEGQKFVIFTDHRPLVGAIGRLSDPKSDRQRRHLSFIAEFAADIRHIAGDTNIVADTLSHPACSTLGAGRPLYADVVRRLPCGGQSAASGSSLVAAASSPSPSPPSPSPPSHEAP
jgi:RNase H-like domain found in reverse transcriptase